MKRFAISFSPAYAVVSRLVLIPPARSFVEVGAQEVHVRMAWAFDARFPRSAVRMVTPYDRSPLSRGVHGFGGRWLVNGSGRDILMLMLEPDQRARVLGAPVTLRELLVSVEDPLGLIAELRG